MRILLADDHTLVRAGLRRILEGFPGMQVVAEARDGREALALALHHQPELVIADWSMPERNGCEIAAELARRSPPIPVLIVSMHDDALHLQRALDAGARGYVVKDAAPAELELALKAIAAGHVFLSPRVSGLLLGPGRGRGHSLSPRQSEILGLLAEGRTTKEIAGRLAISIKTVETHRARIMEALGLKNANQLVHYAVRHALV